MRKSGFRLLCASLFLGALFDAGAQIRSYVGIVRQQYFPEHVKYFEGYRDELNANGYSTYAKYVDSYLKGGFGSGFVYVAADGTNYVITNRHVVSQAASATIEFENADTGDVTKYENLSVLLTDDDIDVAILGFARGEKPFTRGLTFARGAVNDGQEVWSAGFPGLAGDPVWQLGKGTVTNAKARIKDLLDPAISSIIQHSAQVDGGNSGGPLMIASRTGTAGYEVVGINTWKASRRDSTNFAIPVAVIQTLIDKAQQKDGAESDEKALSARTAKLAESLKDANGDFTTIARYISYERASTQGQKDFESVLHFAPSSVRSTVLDAFSYDPAEGLRYASAYQLWKKLSAKENDGAFYVVSAPATADGKSTVAFTTGEGESAKTVQTTWTKEHGLWRLAALASDESAASDGKSSKKKTKNAKSSAKKSGDGDSYFDSPEIDFYDNIVLSAGGDLSINGEKALFHLSVDVLDEITGFSLMYHYVPMEDVSCHSFSIGGLLRLPVAMGQFGFNGYAKLCGNAGFGDSRVFIGYEAEAGVQAMFNVQGDVHYGIGLAFKQFYLTQWMDMKGEDDWGRTRDKLDALTNRCLSLYAIISF